MYKVLWICLCVVLVIMFNHPDVHLHEVNICTNTACLNISADHILKYFSNCSQNIGLDKLSP